MVTVSDSPRMYGMYGVTNVCTIIPSDERLVKTITCKSSQNRQCQCTETCKMDFCFIYLFNFT